MKKIDLGRQVFGCAAILFGVFTLASQDFNGWQQIVPLGHVAHPAILVNLAAAVEILGGLAMQWRRTARIGAAALGTIYFIFALLWVPRILAEPRVYDRWGNFFEQFSQVAGAMIVYATAAEDDGNRQPRLASMGSVSFGICLISFALEQALYLSATADFVPKWIPPGQMFWAVTTTIAFTLAAIALLSGRWALRASRLTTVMIAGFGLLIWLPRLFADPHQNINWAGNAENLSILGAAWIVTDYLSRKRIRATFLAPVKVLEEVA